MSYYDRDLYEATAERERLELEYRAEHPEDFEPEAWGEGELVELSAEDEALYAAQRAEERAERLARFDGAMAAMGYMEAGR